MFQVSPLRESAVPWHRSYTINIGDTCLKITSKSTKSPARSVLTRTQHSLIPFFSGDITSMLSLGTLSWLVSM